jgi:hypothetical protein
MNYRMALIGDPESQLWVQPHRSPEMSHDSKMEMAAAG